MEFFFPHEFYYHYKSYFLHKFNQFLNLHSRSLMEVWTFEN